MPPTGLHGLLGLLLASKIDKKHKFIRIGLVTGSVVPDLDLLGSVLIYILIADKDLTIAFHRSVTHSLIIIASIFIVGYLTSLLYETVRTTYFPFIIGIVTGILLHVSLDMFYLGGVTLFWPFQPFGERTEIIPFTYEDLSPAYNSLLAKIIGIVDGHFELIYYLVFVYFANKYNTNQEIKIELGSRKIMIHSWTKKLSLYSYFLILEMIIFFVIAFLSISLIPIDRDTFIIILYIPLTPVYLLSGILPLLMSDTITHLGDNSGSNYIGISS